MPAGAIAFTGARIITASGDTIENGTVVVVGNRITAVGPGVAVPAGAKQIDASGKTIMPGIVAHFVRAEVKHFGFGEKERALAWLETGR